MGSAIVSRYCGGGLTPDDTSPAPATFMDYLGDGRAGNQQP